MGVTERGELTTRAERGGIHTTNDGGKIPVALTHERYKNEAEALLDLSYSERYDGARTSRDTRSVQIKRQPFIYGRHNRGYHCWSDIMAELTTTQAEEILAKHSFIDRGGAQKEAEGIRFRLFSVGAQSNLLLEVGSDRGIRVLLSTKMEPLVERLKGSGEIVVDESKDFSIAKDDAVKFEIERRGEPYWWVYKVGDYTEAVLLKAIVMYETMIGWGEEITAPTPTPAS